MSETDQTVYQEALAAEFNLSPVADDTTPPVPTTAGGEGADDTDTQPPAAGASVPPESNDKGADGEPTKPQGGEVDKTDEEKAVEAKAAADAEAELVKSETQEETANRHAEEAAKKDADGEPKPLTAEDIRQAIREDRTETQERIEQVTTVQKDIIDTLYPEGIDKNIYDTDGRVIKTAQDIVDRGLINQRTNEPYTYEEAASFMLEAGKKMAENVEELRSWAEDIAEKNVSLLESNQRVMAEWGDILKLKGQEFATELAEEYLKTQLEFDKTGSYIVKMNVSPEVYYRRALSPYKEIAPALAAQRDAEAEKQRQAEAEKAKAEQAEQDERTGLPPQRGNSRQKSNTGDVMVDALVDELNKG